MPSAPAHQRSLSSVSSTSSVTVVRPRLGRRATAAVAVLLALATALLGLALATAVGIVTAAPASAHDRLLSSDPEDGAELDEPPAAITLTFSADLLATGTRVVVTGESGEEVAAGEPAVDRDVVTAALPGDLAGGAYTVAWRAVSSDGHPIEGSFGFDVAEQAVAPSSDASASLEPTENDAASPSPTGEPTDEAEPTDEQSPVPGEATSARSPWLLGAALLAVAAVGTAAVVRGRRGLGSGHGPAGQD